MCSSRLSPDERDVVDPQSGRRTSLRWCDRCGRLSTSRPNCASSRLDTRSCLHHRGGSGFWCVRADTTMRARVLSEASAMCRRLCPLSSMQRNAASQRMTRQNASVIVGLGARPVALCRSDLGSGCPRWVELVQPGWPLERSRSEHTSPSRGFGQRPSWPSPRPGLCGPSDPRRLLRNPHGRFVEVRRHGRRLHIRRRPATLASR
jgi:hypothetical protein